VEVALGVPLYFLLILSMVEMTRLGMAYDLLTLAVREGCRVAVIPGNTQANGESAAKTILNGGGITSYNTPQWTWGSGQSSLSGTHLGDPVTLTISVPFRNVSWLPTPLFLKSATLSASATHCSETPN
jgi:hypothetical protein